MIILDTHAAVWWTQQPELLGNSTEESIFTAVRILIPSIVFWETALLVRKGRLALKDYRPVEEWVDTLEMHPDPADRFIAATALHYKAPLVTKDNLLQSLPRLQTIW